jgi:epoxyqueuosine reductase
MRFAEDGRKYARELYRNSLFVMTDTLSFADLARQIHLWAAELGFAQVGICDTDLRVQKEPLQTWLGNGYHGEMDWLADNLDKRLHPDRLVDGAVRSISVRMNYLPGDTRQIQVLKNPVKAYVSRYALGRDYHKLMRKRLTQLADKIRLAAEPLMPVSQRPFVDSAPVLERPLAVKAGLGWTGKHTLVINREAGSWFFLGEILTNVPLPTNDIPVDDLCGECSACLKVCPTDAFPRPYELDARRCISYLTIEHKGPIPEEFRTAMGNRVFGCDDCQAICPWNKYAHLSQEGDFSPRHGLEDSDLLTLFLWDEPTFLRNTEGSAIRRAGYERWLRNLAIGLGNAPSNPAVIAALEARREAATPLVKEHIEWALLQQKNPKLRGPRKLRRPNR